jgi:hypothetical protein
LEESRRNGWPVAALAEIDHPDGLVNVWSKTGTLDFDGKSWDGIGFFGRIKGIGASKRLAVKQIIFELRGVAPDAITWLSADVRNRTAQAWLVGMDATATKVNGEPLLIVDGLADFQKLRVGDGRDAAIELVIRDPVFLLDRAQNKAWTSEQIKADHGSTITGLDRIPDLVNANKPWTLT